MSDSIDLSEQMHFAPEAHRRDQCVNDGRSAALWTHGHTVLTKMLLNVGKKVHTVKQVVKTARGDTNHTPRGVRFVAERSDFCRADFQASTQREGGMAGH